MLLRLLLTLVFVLLTPGLVRVGWDLAQALVERWELAGALAGGVVLGWILFRRLLGRIPGFTTLWHECKHAVAALVFLRRIHGFVVTFRRGGQVRYGAGFGGELGNHFIGLAPYFLLMASLPAALLLPLAPSTWGLWAPLGLGALLGLDLAGIHRDLRRNFNREVFQDVTGEVTQSDIGRRGYLFTLASVGFYGAAQLVLVLQLVVRGYGGLGALASALWQAWWDTGLWLIAQLS